MKLKDQTVKLPNNKYTAEITAAVDAVWRELGIGEPTCTSGNDGRHKLTSYHYKDRALDIRIWDILEWVCEKVRAKLPPYYDVVREIDHIHIEADEKKEKQ